MDEAKYREVEGRLWSSVGRAPSEQFVQLSRIGVKVRVQEIGDGPPVLFVHGGPNSGSTWAPLVEHVETMRELRDAGPVSGAVSFLPATVDREMVAEQTGRRFRWREKLALEGFVRDRSPAELTLQVRALADLALVLLNSSEFVYVY